MHKKLTLILILILVLAQLCACGKPQAEPSPAAESEAAAPAELPEEEAPDEPDEPAGRTPDRVLTSTKYTAEVYIETTQYGQYQIESREYAVSDGVSAVGLRAAGRGSYIRFFDQTVTEAGTVWYYDKSAGDWRSQALGDGLYASPVVVVELASGQTYFLALPRTFALRENGSREYFPEQDGILRTSVAFPQANARQQEQAESMLTAIMNELNYVGVMAMECFVTAEGLLINELAPRVHNSGHWTQNGASISQFELHLRAITGLPLPPPVVNSPSVMINLIGTDLNYDWLKLPLVHLHWYDKEVRPGRKVGHLNLTDSDTDRLSATLEAIKPLLPPEYTSGLFWAQSQLS